jgi:chemotaxis protein MotB
MRGPWTWGAMMCVLAVGNVGCYYDRLQAAERDNRVLREDLSRSQQDLQDCEMMNREKDTVIDSLNKRMAAKDETISTMLAEAQNLRQALERAQDILRAQAGRGVGPLTIVQQALPEPLHRELQALADAYPNEIEYIPERGAVRFKADLLFPLGSDQLTGGDPSSEALQKFAQIAQSDVAAGFDVVVVGHTCTTPIGRPETRARFPSNWHLSAGRSIAVMELLGSRGVPMRRMGIMGYGEHRPISDNNSEQGKQRNRRVEIFLVPRDSVHTAGMDVMIFPDQGIAYLSGASASTGS